MLSEIKIFMKTMLQIFSLQVLGFIIFVPLFHCQALQRYTFVVEEASYTRLCATKKILTVNGSFPGPTLYANKGDTIIVDVFNKASDNITIHWHGVKQPRNPWADGPEYVTQCPIQPGRSFSQKIILSDEEGTLWWHAHSDWARDTVHGAIIIYPKNGTTYPFPKPHAEIPIILGEWWKADTMEVYDEFLQSGGEANTSDAFTINGQPGDLYPCSKPETFKLKVERGLTYLLRIINCALQDMHFFSIAKHNLTVVATDASYVKPFTSTYLTISPGQTFDVLLEANQDPTVEYYMAARVYSGGASQIPFDNTTTTAILQYNGTSSSSSSSPLLPYLPDYNDTTASVNFTGSLRSLADEEHPIDVPLNISKSYVFTVSMNTIPCPNETCSGPNGTRVAASLNNISFVNPSIDILEAYYHQINGVFGTNFPSFPPLKFNYTANDLPSFLLTPKKASEVKVIDYNSTVEIVLQGTNLLEGTDHPMHLHGYSFYVVGWGLGNFDKEKDPQRYNLVDPPLQNTIAVPIRGWTTIRFKADNPGVWFMHCHLDRHTSWGMNMVFIVKDGEGSKAKMLPPPEDMPPC